MTSPQEIHPLPKKDDVSDLDLEKTAPTHIVPETKKNDAPDGGIQAWSVVLGSWCVLFCSFGWINSKDSPIAVGKIRHTDLLLSDYRYRCLSELL